MKLEDFNVRICGEGKPVLMLHGFELDQTIMVNTFEPLMKDKAYKRIYLDLPGMGLSTNYQNIKNADDMINAICLVVKEIVKEEHFTIIGMSYGGYLARGVLKALKNQVTGMFLFVPVVYPLHKDRMLPVHEVVYEEIEFTKTLNEEVLTELRAFGVILTREIIERNDFEIAKAIERADSEFLSSFQELGYQASYDVDDIGYTFEKPVMILAGKQDSIVGYEDQFRLSKKYKRCTFVALDKAGHGLHAEQDEVFNKLFIHWLDEI